MSRGDPAYLQLLEEMAELHSGKAAGYSGDDPDTWTNFREATQWGVDPKLGVLVRMGDKYRRLQNIVSNPANNLFEMDENDIDTAMDLAAYALIYICLRREDIASGTIRPSSTTEDTQGAGRPRKTR